MIKYIIRKVDHLLHPGKGVVLMLHRVTSHEIEQDQQRYTITPSFLEKTILLYKEKGYQFVSIDEVANMVERKKFKNKFVSFTLDDGYRDNLLEAVPVFRKYNIPYCIFITTDYIGRNDSGYMMLTKNDLQDIVKDPLCTIGAHTISHTHLSQLNDEQKREEIMKSGEILRKMGLGKVEHFAYPYGDMDKSCAIIAREVGYRTAFMAWFGLVRSNSKLYKLPREILIEK